MTALNIKPLAVTTGDPCGIGPDIILKTWHNRVAYKLPEFIVFGSQEVLNKRAKSLGLTIDFTSDTQQHPEKLCVTDLGISCKGLVGRPDDKDAKLAWYAIDQAVKSIWSGDVSAVVTCPISKSVLYKIGFSYPGHTEYLGHLAEEKTGTPTYPVMMISGPELKTVPVTIHIPLQDVAKTLSTQLIITTVQTVADDFKRFFKNPNPRIAISGLNPHAGENGSMGKEEIETIEPAIKALRQNGVDAMGPLPADTMFHASARSAYDVAVCMYHDQALIPAKLLGFENAVNVTLGLPFVRTSPDHGTAYDIAGTGKADESSFVAALKTAATMARST
ncbi:MAG: 4-hydroxythreonine-4-phosphate dehydrogenase PdxA [Pseudomonadota bacterium]